jgi:hypothetical protein
VNTFAVQGRIIMISINLKEFKRQILNMEGKKKRKFLTNLIKQRHKNMEKSSLLTS